MSDDCASWLGLLLKGWMGLQPYMRSVCCELGVCDWISDAFCRVFSSGSCDQAWMADLVLVLCDRKRTSFGSRSRSIARLRASCMS